MWINVNEDFARGLIATVKNPGPVGPTPTPEFKKFVEHLEKEIVNLADPTHEKYREAAAENHEREGELEVDPGAVVAPGDDPGAYVMCWVWVTNEEAGLPPQNEAQRELQTSPE